MGQLLGLVLVVGLSLLPLRFPSQLALHLAAGIVRTLAVALFLGFSASMIGGLFASQTLRRGIRELAALRGAAGVRAIDPLLWVWACGHWVGAALDRGLGDEWSAALTELLPRVRPEDAGAITASSRRALCRLIHTATGCRADPHGYLPLLRGALAALQQVGDRKSLAAVERLAAHEPVTALEREVHIAVRRCLEPLRERVEAGDAEPLLLRPSSARPHEGGALLRPAEGTSDTETERLLRPTTTRGQQ